MDTDLPGRLVVAGTLAPRPEKTGPGDMVRLMEAAPSRPVPHIDTRDVLGRGDVVILVLASLGPPSPCPRPSEVVGLGKGPRVGVLARAVVVAVVVPQARPPQMETVVGIRPAAEVGLLAAGLALRQGPVVDVGLAAKPVLGTRLLVAGRDVLEV